MTKLLEVLDKEGPEQLTHYLALYSSAYWAEWEKGPIERHSVMDSRSHEAALKAVIRAVAEASTNVPS